MTARPSDLGMNEPEHHDDFVDMAPSVQAQQVVQRLTAHRQRLHEEIGQLRREQAEIEQRRDVLRRHVDAVESVFAKNLADIDATLKIYRSGIHSLGPT